MNVTAAPRRLIDVVLDAIERGEKPSVVWWTALLPDPESGLGPPPGRRGMGRRHGFIATYMAGCRCPVCRAANTRYAANRRIAGYTS